MKLCNKIKYILFIFLALNTVNTYASDDTCDQIKQDVVNKLVALANDNQNINLKDQSVTTINLKVQEISGNYSGCGNNLGAQLNQIKQDLFNSESRLLSAKIESSTVIEPVINSEIANTHDNNERIISNEY